MRVRTAFLALLLLGSASLARPQWSAEEMQILRSLWIEQLGPPPPDPSNRVADDPHAAQLGRRLFADTRLSANRRVSCATCHNPADGFVDKRPLGVGVGTGNRRTMPVAAAVYSPWQFWDGRADSLWAQALGPIENPVEHGFTRSEVARTVLTYYGRPYRKIFGPPPASLTREVLAQPASPLGNEEARRNWERLTEAERAGIDEVFVNTAKAIAAFERTQKLPPTRFDGYLDKLFSGGGSPAHLSPNEVAGLRLFIGKGQCTRCHNGPLLTHNGFANTGVPPRPGLPEDRGRVEGVKRALADPFNCRGRFNDAASRQCDELDFAVSEGPELLRAYKVPSLRGVARRAPFMHAGQFRTLEQVLDHYSRAPAAPLGKSEIEPLNLSAAERRSLIAFLKTLTPSKPAFARSGAGSSVQASRRVPAPPSPALGTGTALPGERKTR